MVGVSILTLLQTVQRIIESKKCTPDNLVFLALVEAKNLTITAGN